MMRKIGFYFLSLWILFVLIFIITIKVPICMFENFTLVDLKCLFFNNILPVFSILASLIGGHAYFDFIRQTKGTKELSFKVIEIENVEYEHLTFLATYIIPLVCFQLENLRYVVVLIILLVVIGCIHIRTDMFYANPTLALLKFRIYKVKGLFRVGEIRENMILITREELQTKDQIKYIKLDKRIYYASKIKTNEQTRIG